MYTGSTQCLENTAEETGNGPKTLAQYYGRHV